MIHIRAPAPGEGGALSRLWKELWDTHEAWGGYPGSQDSQDYERVAARLDSDARLRAGEKVLGRHIHLVAASPHGEIVGQVEGWVERHGLSATTPHTCEVRSLVVRRDMRGKRIGEKLLAELYRCALRRARGGPIVLAAEVLEPNPAHSFYARLGFRTVAYSTRLVAPDGFKSPFSARVARASDALSVALLESGLAARRRANHDTRFDGPRTIDATLVSTIADHLAFGERGPEPLELVVTRGRSVLATASFATSPLEPPFLPLCRGLLGRFALGSRSFSSAHLLPLVKLALMLGKRRGTRALELTDLTPPGSALYEAALSLGAKPWSRTVLLGRAAIWEGPDAVVHLPASR